MDFNPNWFLHPLIFLKNFTFTNGLKNKKKSDIKSENNNKSENKKKRQL